MKVIAFNGSPRKDGVSARGVSVMAAELEKEGIETEIIQVGNLKIQGCLACRKCAELKRCCISDDPVNESFEKMQKADGIILASPVYYGGIAGTFKSFLDRLFFPGVKMKYKAGTTVVSLRRTGGISVFQQLNNYFNLAQMIITPGIYWNVIHGNTQEEVLQDEEGLCIMETQGKNMAWLIKCLEAGKKEVPMPELPPRKRTNFIH
ncbi:MAG: flavodoxin family protein [Treponema sp.]|nr:flavodoxin family protein [Treponema sp.]